jgi:hypothetical protein
MEDSILLSTKKILGLAPEYTVFDQDIMTHINATFSVLQQLGIGPVEGFSIVDEGATWGEYLAPAVQLHLVKTYMYLKVRMAFDPPGTSFLIDAMQKQIDQYEWRLNVLREYDLEPHPTPLEEGARERTITNLRNPRTKWHPSDRGERTRIS